MSPFCQFEVRTTLLKSVYDLHCEEQFIFSFLFFSFLPFCCLFSCCNFCFGSACHGRGRGENLSGGAGGGVVVFGFAVTCGSVVDRVRCALECSEPYRLSVAESY